MGSACNCADSSNRHGDHDQNKGRYGPDTTRDTEFIDNSMIDYKSCFDRNKKHLKQIQASKEDERLQKKFGSLGKKIVKNDISDTCLLDMKDPEFLEFRKFMKGRSKSKDEFYQTMKIIK